MKSPALVLCLCLCWRLAAQSPPSAPAVKLSALATLLGDSLSRIASREYGDPNRKAFARWPGRREGLRLSAMDAEQKALLHDVLNDVLSAQGYLKVLGIIGHEDAHARTDEQLGREAYWLCFFGRPGDDQWAVRFEGHHMSLQLAFRQNTLAAATPLILGGYPAVMRDEKWAPLDTEDAYREGYQVLFAEEEYAIDLYNALPAGLRARARAELPTGVALVAEDADVTDRRALRTAVATAAGIPVDSLPPDARARFRRLLGAYAGNFADAARYERCLGEGTRLVFSGDVARDTRFYYRIVSACGVIEFQSLGNHVHCLIREFEGDFGGD